MLNNALIVFTAKTVSMIQHLRGTQSWVLSPTSMRHVKYVVCARNSDHAYDEECGPRTEEHGEAFLVGRVSGLKKVDRRNNRDRYLVQISEYALVSVPRFWTMGRNPTHYTNTEALMTQGIDVDALDWQPMPDLEGAFDDADAKKSPMEDGLTIVQAKRGLSIKFGVPEESIQIVING